METESGGEGDTHTWGGKGGERETDPKCNTINGNKAAHTERGDVHIFIQYTGKGERAQKTT